ncbi:hypothetical protein [Plantactinospora soyae]|uniref:PPE family domain-containing protein n=1 Tax=Plantactinospora soyae TaxID=1544732 RepID=A0A927M9K6_9ACTN|nr:hypothetical protein [Plantactinospora soyae]MBE1487000.1 hypothetical protein [Plantactinospora soyae]
MLDGGGTGGVAGTTNWVGQNVDDMWPKLANQQTDTHWQHVSGWQKTSELSSIHLSRLKQYRESLIEAWPPEKSEASRAYVARLDFLIGTVQGVHDTAVANHQTFKSVTQAIWESRGNLEKIYNDYQVKKQAKLRYDADVAANQGKPPAGTTPTTDADLEDLNWQARHVMYGLSSELATAQMQLRQPPKYRNEKGRVDDPPGGGGGSEAMGGSTPPVFPPVVPISSSGGGASYTASPSPAIQTVVTTTPPPGTGPILGTTAPVAPPPVTPTPPSVIPPAPPPTTGPGLPPPIAPPGLPPGTKPPVSGYPISSTNTGLNKAPGYGPNAGVTPRAMPPGGMIGGAPGSGLSQPASGAGAARRINPVGGVIGGASGGAGTTPLGGAGQRPGSGMGRGPMGSGQTLGMGAGGRSGDRSKEEQGVQHWDPDNPWETDEGVAPVMMPGRENRRIDPGPAIGYNR